MFTLIRFFFLFCIFLSSTQAKQISYTTVPLDLTSWAPIVLVTIENKQFPLLFDLGGANLEITLSSTILNKLTNVKFTGKTRTINDAQGRKAVLREFILPKIQIADLALTHIKGLENHSFPWGSPGEPPADVKNGIIGLSLASQFNLIIDYGNKKLILIKGNGYPPTYDIDSWQKIPFTLNGNIVTTMTFGNKKINLLWDTGAPFNLIKDTVKIPGNFTKCPKNVLSELGKDADHCSGITATANNHLVNQLTFYVDSLKGLPADGVIGEPFFKNHIVYINFSKGILAVN